MRHLQELYNREGGKSTAQVQLQAQHERSLQMAVFNGRVDELTRSMEAQQKQVQLMKEQLEHNEEQLYAER